MFYSGTCLERPPYMPLKCGLSRQVVFHDKVLSKVLLNQGVLRMWSPKKGGLSRQWSPKTGFTVVLIVLLMPKMVVLSCSLSVIMMFVSIPYMPLTRLEYTVHPYNIYFCIPLDYPFSKFIVAYYIKCTQIFVVVNQQPRLFIYLL